MRPLGRGLSVVGVLSSIGLPLAGAAALFAGAEILLDRIGAALVAYLAPTSPGLARILEAAGTAAAGTTALLVIAAAAALGAARSRTRLARTLLLTATFVTLIVSVTPGTGGAVLVHSLVVAGAAALAVEAESRGVMRAAIVSAALGVALGQVPFLAPGLGDWALVRIGAEAGLLAAVALAGMAWTRRSAAAPWLAGAIAATAASTLILARPAFTAMLSTWALGATLALPLLAYIAAAWGAGVLLWGARTDRAIRLVAAGLALLWVAGTAPTAIHHNLSALLGLLLLTIPPGALATDGAAEQTGVRWRS